jgi:hypothetical protein
VTFRRGSGKDPKRNEVDEKGIVLFFLCISSLDLSCSADSARFERSQSGGSGRLGFPEVRASKVTNFRVEGDGRSEHRWSQKCRWTVTDNTVKKGLRSHFGRWMVTKPRVQVVKVTNLTVRTFRSAGWPAWRN